jgi:hypothetical protein
MCKVRIWLLLAVVAMALSLVGCSVHPITREAQEGSVEYVQFLPAAGAFTDPQVVAAMADMRAGERTAAEVLVNRAVAAYELGEQRVVETMVERALQEQRAGERESFELAPTRSEMPANIWWNPRTVPEGNIWLRPQGAVPEAAPSSEGASNAPRAPADAWEAYRLGERTGVSPDAAAGALPVPGLTQGEMAGLEAATAWAAYRAGERTPQVAAPFAVAWAAYRAGERTAGTAPPANDAEVDLSAW